MIKNKFNYLHRGVRYEPGIGLTEPGLAMDIPTILRRYAQGTLSGLSTRNPVFDDLDYPDPTERPDFDLTDATEFLNEFRAKRQRSAEAKATKSQPTQPRVSAEETPPVGEAKSESPADDKERSSATASLKA